MKNIDIEMIESMCETLVCNKNEILAETLFDTLPHEVIEAVALRHMKSDEKRKARLRRKKPAYKRWLKKYIRMRRKKGKNYRPNKDLSRIAKKVSKFRIKT